MNTILLVVTVASLATSALLSIAVWRLRRQERRRSEARVEALAEALYDDNADKSQIVADLLETRPASEWRRQLMATAIGVAAVAVAAGLMAIPARMSARSAKASRSSASAASSGSARLQPSDSASVPLELIALEHERTGDDLVVRGLLRNPPDAAERDGLSAVVLLLDAGGDVIATARASVPAERLGPGATTPFVVNATGAGDVDRFRLSFRIDGRIEPHVDRRSPRT